MIGICFRSHAWNDADLIKILHSSISIIKNHVVYSLLIAIGKACWSFVGHHTRVVPCPPRPKTNDALPRLDMRVTWKFIKDYCRASLPVQQIHDSKDHLSSVQTLWHRLKVSEQSNYILEP